MRCPHLGLAPLLAAPRLLTHLPPRRTLFLRSLLYPPRSRSTGPPYQHMVQLGDPVLRAPCSLVKQEDFDNPVFTRLLANMEAALTRYDAVGVSAPQLGVPLRVSMARLTAAQLQFWSEDVRRRQQMEEIPLKVIINPVMTVVDSSEVTARESCCSMAGYSALVPRAREVRLVGLNPAGQPVQWEARGWAARIAQHEQDHLAGKMFIDRAHIESLECDYWNIVNSRHGDFRLGFQGQKVWIAAKIIDLIDLNFAAFIYETSNEALEF